MPYYPELGVYIPAGRPIYIRPIRVDTLDIDVSKPRRFERLLQPQPLSRGRSVVRIRTMRRAPRPSPGARLIQKFIIPEKKPTFERPADLTAARQAVFSHNPEQGSIQVRERGGVREPRDFLIHEKVARQHDDGGSDSKSLGVEDKFIPSENSSAQDNGASSDYDNEKTSVQEIVREVCKETANTQLTFCNTNHNSRPVESHLCPSINQTEAESAIDSAQEHSKPSHNDSLNHEIKYTHTKANGEYKNTNDLHLIQEKVVLDVRKEEEQIENNIKSGDANNETVSIKKPAINELIYETEKDKNNYNNINALKEKEIKESFQSQSFVAGSQNENSVIPINKGVDKRLETESLIKEVNPESEAKSRTGLDKSPETNDRTLEVASKNLLHRVNISDPQEKTNANISPHNDGRISKSDSNKQESPDKNNAIKKKEGHTAGEQNKAAKDFKSDERQDDASTSKCGVNVQITACENQGNSKGNVDKNNNLHANDDFDSEVEVSVEEEDMETGDKKKKKVMVKKKNGKVKVTNLDGKKPAVKKIGETATAGEIKRQNSKKRLSLVDDQLGLERKTSISDEVIQEEAAYLDSMILETMKDQGRRKSSLAFPPQLPDIEEEKRPCMIEEEKEEVVAQTSVKDTRRDQWHKAAVKGDGPATHTLGKFYRGRAKEEESSDEECDVNCHWKCRALMPNLCGVNQKLIAEALANVKRGRSLKESSESTASTSLSSNINSESTESSSDGQEPGRVTPPATSLPRFREYSITDFQFLKVLGKGSFGKVLLAELNGTGCYYAVKALKKDIVLEDDDVECTMIERKVLTLGTGHPYFCHLFCTFQTESHLFFVMEYLNGGDLMFHIQESGRFDEGRARFYSAEIVSGLKFLHKWGIVYRDLKLDNVLLDFEGHARIADFGMCKLQIYLDKTTDTFCGTPDYMAPEIIKGLKYNQCVDWWSFGVLLYEMLVGQSPFSGCDEDDLFWSVCNERPQIPRYVSKNARNMLLALMEKDWTKRLGTGPNGAQDVMGHPFFEGLCWSLLERREIKPPYKPTVKHPLDTKYFDKAFTQENPRLTPVDRRILESMDQSQFEGFSYTNPNVTE